MAIDPNVEIAIAPPALDANALKIAGYENSSLRDVMIVAPLDRVHIVIRSYARANCFGSILPAYPGAAALNLAFTVACF